MDASITPAETLGRVTFCGAIGERWECPACGGKSDSRVCSRCDAVIVEPAPEERISETGP